jgi:hypothetical protein
MLCQEDVMNAYRTIAFIGVFIAAFSETVGCTKTAVSPDEVVEFPLANTVEQMPTATAVLL